MSKSVIVSVISLLCLFLFVWTVESRPPRNECPPCPPEGCLVPADCTHGVVTDICGRSSCAMGPGDFCKMKRFGSQGNCGEGMYCYCGVCMGCSLFTYDCFETTCVFPFRRG